MNGEVFQSYFNMVYVDPLKMYFGDFFQTFKYIMESRNDVLFIVWWIEPQANIEYVAFKFNFYMFHKIGPNIGIVSMVKNDK